MQVVWPEPPHRQGAIRDVGHIFPGLAAIIYGIAELNITQPGMGIFFWKNNREIDATARAVADDLFSYVQPGVARQHLLGKGKVPRKQAIKVEQKFNDVILQIQRFSKAKGLGVYGKARLQQKFNERIEELGYDADVVNKLSETILLRNT